MAHSDGRPPLVGWLRVVVFAALLGLAGYLVLTRPPVSDTGITPEGLARELQLAIIDCDADTVAHLLDAGADPDLELGSWDQSSPVASLWHCDDTGVIDAVATASDRFPEPNAGNPGGIIRGGNDTLLAAMMRAGYDPLTLVERPDRPATTLLHAAAMTGSVDLLTVMLDAGLDPDTPDGAGQTPLAVARAAHDTRTDPDRPVRPSATGAERNTEIADRIAAAIALLEAAGGTE